MWVLIPGSDALVDDPGKETTLPESLDKAALLKMLQSLAQARTADGDDGEDGDSDDMADGDDGEDGGEGREGGSKKKKRSSARLRNAGKASAQKN